MAVAQDLRYELERQVRAVDIGKTYISVRFEPNAKIARVGACIANYDWETRDKVLDALLDFEDGHSDDFTLEFDILPLDAVTDSTYAEI